MNSTHISASPFTPFAIEELERKIVEGYSVMGSVLEGLNCSSCKKPIPDAIVQDTVCHDRECLWHYCVYCPACEYGNSLAKMTRSRYECRCVR